MITGHVLPAIRIEVASLSKIILFALLNMFHCRTKFNWFPSFQDHTVTCLWSSANATNSEFCEMAQHKIRKFSFGGCGTSATSCLGNGSGMDWILVFSTSYLKKDKFNIRDRRWQMDDFVFSIAFNFANLTSRVVELGN